MTSDTRQNLDGGGAPLASASSPSAAGSSATPLSGAAPRNAPQFEIFPLKELAAPVRNAIVGGPFGSNLVSKDYIASGVPVIRGQNMSDGKWVGGEFAYVSREKAHSLSQNVARPGDIVFTQRGTLGQVAVVPDSVYEEYIVSQSQMKVTVDSTRIDNHYLYYVFKDEQMQAYIRANAIQVGVPHTNLGILKETPIPVPSLDVQKSIAKILGDLDDKIEVNRRINQTLEEMAQAIFKSWFVDFDPVKAKIAAQQGGRDPLRAAMCAISGKAESEIDAMPRAQFDQLAATAALFPDEMEESELGEIPVGWKVETLSALIEFNPRYTLKKGVVAPYLDMKNAPTQGHLADDVVPREFGSGAKFSNGDTLLARITPCLENGKTAFVDFLRDGEVGWGSTEFIVMRPKEPIPVSIGYLIARLDAFRSVAIQSMTGTSGRQRAEADALAKSKWIRYPLPLLQELDRLAGKYLEVARSNGQQMKHLACLRDALLPKLLSGELSVDGIPAGAD